MEENKRNSVTRFEGTWQKLSFRMSGSNPVTFDTSLDFLVGNVISAFSSDVPSMPKNFKVESVLTVSSPAHVYNVKVSFDKPSTVPNETNYPITKYILTYSKVGGPNVSLDIPVGSGNITNYTLITTAPPNNPISFGVGTYYFGVRAVTGVGNGEKSESRKLMLT